MKSENLDRKQLITIIAMLRGHLSQMRNDFDDVCDGFLESEAIDSFNVEMDQAMAVSDFVVSESDLESEHFAKLPDALLEQVTEARKKQQNKCDETKCGGCKCNCESSGKFSPGDFND